MLARHVRLGLVIALLAGSVLSAQQPAPPPLDSSGKLSVPGGLAPYLIRHLPVGSFPELPQAVSAELTRRGCLIPQTYEAHGPENVIHGSFERAGSDDWAVLCSTSVGSTSVGSTGAGSAGWRVSLLVFFASAPGAPKTLASSAETDRLSPHPGYAEWGFNWGIDPASPGRVHEAQNGLEPRPPATDHDAVADSEIDRKTVYRYWSNGAWSELPLPK